MTELCSIEDIDEGFARGFRIDGGQTLFLVRKNNEFFGYINNCPHAGWPLNLLPDKFLSLDKEYIQCSNHMALFEISSGVCVDGPCVGAGLQKLDLEIINGCIHLKA